MNKSYKSLIQQFEKLSGTQPVVTPVSNRQKYEKLLKWIEQNIDKDINLLTLTQVSELSNFELIQQFKVNTKLTPMQFLREYREFRLGQSLSQLNEKV